MKNGFIVQDDIKNLYKVFGFDVSKPGYSIQNLKGEYKTVHKYPTDKLLKKHLEGNYSVCLSSFEFSKMFQIDIDCKDGIIRKTRDTIKKLVSEIGEPVFIEQSNKSTGGYHLYYKFNKSNKSMQKYWSEFQMYFNTKYKTAIEIMKGNKKLKLPFSINYTSHGTYDSKKMNLIQQKDFDDCINIIKNCKETEFLLFDQMKSIIKQKEAEQKKLIKVPTKVNERNKVGWQDFYYCAGTRFVNQFKIATRAICHGLSFSDFVDECYLYDQGSRDMAKWKMNGTVEKELRSIFSYCERYNSLNPEYVTQYKKEDIHNNNNNSSEKKLVLKIDPDKVLSDKEETKFKELLNKVYQDKKSKQKENRVNGLIKLYKVIIAMFGSRVNYTSEFDFLNNGVMVTEDLLRLIGKSQNITNPIEKFNTLKSLKLFKAIRGIDGRAYCYEKEKVHFAIHYKPMSLQKTFELLEELFKKFFSAVKLKLDLKVLTQKINIDTFSNSGYYTLKNNDVGKLNYNLGET